MAVRDAAPFNRHEEQVIVAAVNAHALVPNGHFLVSEGRRKAAERLISGGYLSKVEDLKGLGGGTPLGIIVRIDQEQFDRVRAAIIAAKSDSETP